MKVSLNKANKLRNALEGLLIEIPLTGTVRSDTNPLTIREAFKQASKATHDAVGKNLEKIRLLYRLRVLISDANSMSEASLLMADIASHEKALAFLGSVGSQRYGGSTGSSLDDILGAINHAEELKRADPKLAQPPKNYAASLLTEEIKKEIADIIKKFRLELEELKEKRNELNHTTIIELPNELVEFLREYSLIK